MDLNYLYDSFKEISKIIRFTDKEKLSKESGKSNSSDDRVNYLDLESNKLIIDSINKYDNIIGYISEENETLVLKSDIDKSKKNYLLMFDPLDGSKNVLNNITIGSIYMLVEYDSENDELKDIVEAGYCLYGPGTVLVKTNKISGEWKVEMYQLNYENEFVFDRYLEELKDNKLYCLNQSNNFDRDIENLVTYFKCNNYNMRWIGSMVADCHTVLLKGGIFMYPSNKDNKNGKIRLLYEAMPFSFIFDKLGGVGLNSSYHELLDNSKRIKLKEYDVHKKVPLILCSKKMREVLLTIEK